MECKAKLGIQERLQDLDLIETLWNVKLLGDGIQEYAKARFNRDIVECKAERVFTVGASPHRI